MSVSDGGYTAAPSWLHLILILTSPRSYSLLSRPRGDTLLSHHQSSQPVPCHPTGKGAVPCAFVLFRFVYCVRPALFSVLKVSWVGLALVNAPP